LIEVEYEGLFELIVGAAKVAAPQGSKIRINNSCQGLIDHLFCSGAQ
jgi:hypothetical protein